MSEGINIVQQLCIESVVIEDSEGRVCHIEQGRVYTTSRPKEDSANVTVFTNYWVSVPKKAFVFKEQKLLKTGGVDSYYDKMFKGEALLRKLLALAISDQMNTHLYGDDGELQLGVSMPFMYIDFVRDSIEEIDRKISDIHLSRYLQKLETQKSRNR